MPRRKLSTASGRGRGHPNYASPDVAEHRLQVARDIVVERLIRGEPHRGSEAELRQRLENPNVSGAALHRYLDRARTLIADECRAAHEAAVELHGPLDEAGEAEVARMLAEPVEPVAVESKPSAAPRRHRRHTRPLIPPVGPVLPAHR